MSAPPHSRREPTKTSKECNNAFSCSRKTRRIGLKTTGSRLPEPTIEIRSHVTFCFCRRTFQAPTGDVPLNIAGSAAERSILNERRERDAATNKISLQGKPRRPGERRAAQQQPKFSSFARASHRRSLVFDFDRHETNPNVFQHHGASRHLSSFRQRPRSKNRECDGCAPSPSKP